MKWFLFIKKLFQGAAVLVAIIAITSISIDATDTFQNSQSALGILARYVTEPTCPDGTITLRIDTTILCVDTYEASVGDTCSVRSPASDIETSTNSNDADCLPVSVAGKEPWRHVTVVQAEQLCARAGKRLLTTLEWYQAALGTPDGEDNCAVTGALRRTGELTRCQSGTGTFDMIGNVWELVSGTVVDGSINAIALPPSGFVDGIQSDGIPSVTSPLVEAIYNSDYFWSSATGTYAVMRGGFYGSGSDGGLYSTHAAITQDFSSAAIGFRCVSYRSN